MDLGLYETIWEHQGRGDVSLHPKSFVTGAVNLF